MKRLVIAAGLVLSMLGDADAQEKANPFTGCYAEAAIGGQSQVLDNKVNRTVNQASGGAGCNAAMGGAILGGGLRLNFGSGTRELEINGKVGVLINDGLMAYGLAAYAADAKSHVIDTKNGVLSAGAGVQFVVTKQTDAFIELSRDLAKFGTAREVKENTQVKAGVRFKLN